MDDNPITELTRNQKLLAIGLIENFFERNQHRAPEFFSPAVVGTEDYEFYNFLLGIVDEEWWPTMTASDIDTTIEWLNDRYGHPNPIVQAIRPNHKMDYGASGIFLKTLLVAVQ